MKQSGIAVRGFTPLYDMANGREKHTFSATVVSSYGSIEIQFKLCCLDRLTVPEQERFVLSRAKPDKLELQKISL
ncbi:MAG: hypothetical protein ABR577_15015 [Pyrinomonadaceae bacterium]